MGRARVAFVTGGGRGIAWTPGGPFHSIKISAVVTNVGPVAACEVRLHASAIGTSGFSGVKVPRVDVGQGVRPSVPWFFVPGDLEALRGVDVQLVGYQPCR